MNGRLSEVGSFLQGFPGRLRLGSVAFGRGLGRVALSCSEIHYQQWSHCVQTADYHWLLDTRESLASFVHQGLDIRHQYLGGDNHFLQDSEVNFDPMVPASVGFT